MAFHPQYWSQPVKNGSAEFNYYEWNSSRPEGCGEAGQERHAQAAEARGADGARSPGPPDTPSRAGSSSSRRRRCTRPCRNTTGRARYSIDFRTVNRTDLESGRAAPNIDSACTGTSLRDFAQRRRAAARRGEVVARGRPRGRARLTTADVMRGQRLARSTNPADHGGPSRYVRVDEGRDPRRRRRQPAPEETEIKPKPMVEIGGRPILWHIMKHYAHFGFKRLRRSRSATRASASSGTWSTTAIAEQRPDRRPRRRRASRRTRRRRDRRLDGRPHRHRPGHGDRRAHQAPRALPRRRDLHAHLGRRRLRRRPRRAARVPPRRTASSPR